jgi:hypothetical protein
MNDDDDVGYFSEEIIHFLKNFKDELGEIERAKEKQQIVTDTRNTTIDDLLQIKSLK